MTCDIPSTDPALNRARRYRLVPGSVRAVETLGSRRRVAVARNILGNSVGGNPTHATYRLPERNEELRKRGGCPRRDAPTGGSGTRLQHSWTGPGGEGSVPIEWGPPCRTRPRRLGSARGTGVIAAIQYITGSLSPTTIIRHRGMAVTPDLRPKRQARYHISSGSQLPQGKRRCLPFPYRGPSRVTRTARHP